MTELHIYAPPVIERRIVADKCPDCKKHTRFLLWGYQNYGSSTVCLRCGRHFEGGEWIPLDFVRGSRQKSIDAAKAKWREGKVSLEGLDMIEQSKEKWRKR